MSLAAALQLPIQATPQSQSAKPSPADREPPPKRPFAEVLQQSRADPPKAPVAPVTPPASAAPVQALPAESTPSDDIDPPADAGTESPARSQTLRPRGQPAGGMTTCSAPAELESAARVATSAANEGDDPETSDGPGLAAPPPAAESWRAILVAPVEPGRVAAPANGATNSAAVDAERALVDAAPARPASSGAEIRGSDAVGGAAALVAATPNAATPAVTAPPAPAAPLVVATPVDSPDFAAAFGLQVSLLAKDGIQQAELHLNPAELGPVSIHIALAGSEARIDFGADLAATRHAIEQGLPELAGALRDAGFTLAGGGISQHAGERHGSDGGGAGQRHRHRRLPPIAAVDAPSLARAARAAGAGGVDLYA